MPVDGAKIYLDASGSMVGFVSRVEGQTSDEFPYARLVVNLDEQAERLIERDGVKGGANIFAFGQTVRSANRTDLFKAAELCVGRSCNSFYTEKPFNQESRIEDAVSDIIQGSENQVGIIVTDLFLRTRDLIGDSRQAIRPLIEALESGRTVGLIGVKSSFNGTVYDLPGEVKQVSLQGQRPVFALIVGPQNAVERMIDGIMSEFQSLSNSPEAHAIIFGGDPIGPVQTMESLRSARAVNRPRGLRNVGRPLVEKMDRASQYRLTDSNDFRFNVDLRHNQSQLQYAPPWGRLEISASLWTRYPADAECSFESWKKSDGTPFIGRGANVGDLTVFDQARQLSPSNAVHVIDIWVRAVELALDSDDTRWLSDWSFDSIQAVDLVENEPAFFRTLNLRNFSTALLDVVVQRMAKRKPLLAHLTVAIDVD